MQTINESLLTSTEHLLDVVNKALRTTTNELTLTVSEVLSLKRVLTNYHLLITPAKRN